MNNAQETFGLVRKLVAKKGVTINKMLLDCNLGKSLIADAERRNAFPTADKIALIADYLEVTTDYLLTSKDTDLHVMENETADNTKNDKENIEMNLTPKTYEVLARMFQNYAKRLKIHNDKIDARELGDMRDFATSFLPPHLTRDEGIDVLNELLNNGLINHRETIDVTGTSYEGYLTDKAISYAEANDLVNKFTTRDKLQNYIFPESDDERGARSISS